MASIRIVLDPEAHGIGAEFQRAMQQDTLIHLADDAEIVVSGLPDGMASGAPSMMFGFVLPDGRCVIAETSWKLFAAAYRSFAAKFGDDIAGLSIGYDATGSGVPVRMDLVSDDAPQFFECQICGDRIDEGPGREAALRILQWVHRHFREKHPGEQPPEMPYAADD